ncbi:hypothetical protein B7R54_12605 [Subtercola boreus]|uniref:Uncharacterized protein n=1 Tax=Subtercola boreus TaxID=120213 RepID=A0A3E0VM27_9MICO|nr:DUF3027 domain-containing protein [Subtercola boreus]RFA09947.1 hypothetical protein B7R54_12605 [Subtercola boreus]TQL52911.1 DUF3027 family protein [Subtercola boreus]
MTENAFPEEPGETDAGAAPEADPVLLAAVDQARSALAEITPADTIGELIGHAVEGEHVLSLFFASKLAGYPDWHWTATLSRIDGSDEPSVLEVELLPGETSVLSPAWVPWADRLTADALIDDSESEFDEDDEDEDGSGDDSAGDWSDEDSDDEDSDGEDSDDEDSDDDSDGDDSDGDSDDDDPDDDDPDDDDPSAIGLRRDRDGIDIDTIAEEGLEAQGFDAHAAATPVPDPEPLIEASAAGVDPDAGAAFDATDDFTDAGDIEDLEGQERSD